jgi:hypothetical protein
MIFKTPTVTSKITQCGTKTIWLVVLGGVMVIVLAIGTKVRGFKPGQERWIFRAIKIHSSGGEVKPSAPCHKILRHVKDPLRYDRY